MDAADAQQISFDSIRRLWVIEGMRRGVAVTPRLLVDAEGRADDPAVRIVDDTVDVTHARGAEARRRIPPSPWAFFLGLTALGAALALRARSRALARQKTLLACARSAVLRDGLLYVEGETSPRRVEETPAASAWHLSGPVMWQPSSSGGDAEGMASRSTYRRSAVARAADLVPGDLAEHDERAKIAVAHAFAFFAATIGCGAVPVLAAGVAHAIDPGDVVTFHPAPVKPLATLRSACAPGTDLSHGLSASLGERPPHAPREELKAWFCLDSRQVDVASYRACVGSGACTAPHSADQASCNWNRPGSDATLPMNCVSRQEASTYCEAQGQRLASAAESPADLEEHDRVFKGLPPDPARATRCDAYLCPHEQHGGELYMCDESGCSIAGAAAVDHGFRCVSTPRARREP